MLASNNNEAATEADDMDDEDADNVADDEDDNNEADDEDDNNEADDEDDNNNEGRCCRQGG